MARLVALLMVVACGLSTACGAITPTAARDARLNADFSGSGPGKLDDARALTGVEPQLAHAASLAARITYTSTSGVDDSHPRVTGTVFVPRGQPPRGGWPIIALGHPQTGIGHACAPSRSPTLLGISGLVTDLLTAGSVVTVSDYQGLGVDDVYHPFFDSSTVGFNLIDSVFATRRLVPATAIDWIALGISQGGQAAWAADELADNAGQGLHLVGAVGVSPVADFEGLVDEAADGGLTAEQKVALQAYLASLKREYPDFDIDAYARGIARDQGDALDRCLGEPRTAHAELADQIGPDDLRPANTEAAQTLRGYLRKTNLPQGPMAAPMLVVYGDRDPLIPAEWTERAISRACAMDDTITRDVQLGKAPDDLNLSGAFAWIHERFDGAPAANACIEKTAS